MVFKVTRALGTVNDIAFVVRRPVSESLVKSQVR